MIIYKETEVKNPLCIVKLNNGVMLYVYENHVESSDGKNYECVEEEVADGEYKIIGWCQV